MCETLVVTRMRMVHVDGPTLDRFRAAMLKALGDVSGFQSVSWWQRGDDLYSFAVVSHFDSQGAADAGYVALSEAPVMLEGNLLLQGPPELASYEVMDTSGVGIDGVGVGQYLSLSRRVAEPGFADRLHAELKTIFGELRVIDGCLGSVIARNATLEDEVAGIVFWNERGAFEESMPKHSLYEVALYGRVL